MPPAGTFSATNHRMAAASTDPSVRRNPEERVGLRRRNHPSIHPFTRNAFPGDKLIRTRICSENGAPGTTRTCDTRFRKPGYHCPVTHRITSFFPIRVPGRFRLSSTLFDWLRLSSRPLWSAPSRLRVPSPTVMSTLQRIREHSGSSGCQRFETIAREERNLAVQPPPTTTRCAPSGASRERELLLVVQAAVAGARRRAIRSVACHRKAQ